MEKKRILIVDDEKLIRWSLEQILTRAGYQAESAGCGAEAMEMVESFRPHLVFLDINLPDTNGLKLLPEIKALAEDILVVMITANAFADSLVEALQLGASDYLAKAFQVDTVLETVTKLFAETKPTSADSGNGLRKINQFEHEQMVGNSRRMIETFKLIQVAAETDCKTVLILGESGTGKELVAKAVHNHSYRKDKPFIELNCAAIPDNLLENELFGHEKGAYTDAFKEQKGVFECADGGTVFLDEIGDMPLHMQAKILKVIENKRFRRVGGKKDQQVDVRIVAATNQNLLQLVEEEKFRKDLFFRLNLLTIQLPALRERIEDIPNLAQYFIQRLNVEYGLSVSGISPTAMEKLNAYDWPGNVRELRNVIERAMLLEKNGMLAFGFLDDPADTSSEISTQHQGTAQAPDTVNGASQHIMTLPPEGIRIEELERSLIRQALERFNGNQTKAAKTLGISRDTLRYRLKKMLEASVPPPEPANDYEPFGSQVENHEPIKNSDAKQLAFGSGSYQAKRFLL